MLARHLLRRIRPLFVASSLAGAGLLTWLVQPQGIRCETSAEASGFTDWKRSTIGEYENRLRYFSHPHKVFQYFASVKKGDGKFMTARDLIRSLMAFRPEHKDHHSTRVHSAEMFFQLADMDGDGLISYPEYVVFLTLLATPEFHWKIAFKLFDDNGDGTVSKHEFQKIMNHATSELSIGQQMGNNERHLNISETGLSRLFFGPKGDKPLTFDVFSDFMRRLRLEILKLEFHQFNVDKETSISLKDFGASLLMFVNPKDQRKYEDRLGMLPESNERISFQQFFAFDQMIRTRLHDLDMAYRFYSAMSPRGFNKQEFRSIVHRVTKCDLTDGQLDVIYTMFDKNQDGQLDQNEFLTALKYRNTRGLTHIRDTGLFAWFERVRECVSQQS